MMLGENGWKLTHYCVIALWSSTTEDSAKFDKNCYCNFGLYVHDVEPICRWTETRCI